MMRSARALKCLSWRRGKRKMRKSKGKAMGKELGRAPTLRISQQGRKEDTVQKLDDPTVLGGRKSRCFMPIFSRRRRQRIREI